MKPQKRSIKDFFSSVSRGPQESSTGTPQLQEANDARVLPRSVSKTSQDPIHLTPNTPSAPARPSTSSTPHAPTIKAPGPNAQPLPASQTSANSGASKRVVSNGEQVVLNSDSDTDSLPDIDWGLPTSSVKTVALSTRSKRTTDYDDDGLRKPEKRAKTKKPALDHVFETVQKNREIEQVIVERKAVLDNNDQEAVDFVFNEDALGQAVHDDDDPDQAHRLFLVMQRTNVTQEEYGFHFFHDTSDSIAVQSRFPVHSLPNHHWTCNFRDASARDQAFLTGFAHQIFRLHELPQDMASWMIDQICLDQCEALNSKYLEILEAHSHYFHRLLDRNRLDAIFRTLGGDVKSLCSNAQLAPHAPAAKAPSLPPSLKSTAKLLGTAARWLRTKARSHAINILYHVCMDYRVLADPDVLGALQNAIEAAICNFADNHKLVQGLSDVLPPLLSRVTHPVLQRSLVCALPAISPLTAYLRRYLALAFIFHPMTIDVPLADPQLPAILHNHLETSPNFRINKEINYRFFAARMILLDMAIGPGIFTVPYHPITSPAPSQAGSSPAMAPSPASSEVKEFNKEVDALALHIKMLGNSIVEAGAVVDLSILEAKDCIERLCSRLEYAVRIGGKQSHNMFGNDDEEKQLKVTDIFRKTAAKAHRAAPTSGIFDGNDAADVDEAIVAPIQTEVAS